MSSFFDATCTKCRKRFGWSGELKDRQPCPGCGHQIPLKELEEDEKLIKELRQKLLAREKDKKAPPKKKATIAEKVAHVKAEGQTREHHCHWPGCEKQVPPAMWGCRLHWYTLPQELRNKVWAAYVPGQEKTFTPSKDYLKAARAVQEWIKKYEKEKKSE